MKKYFTSLLFVVISLAQLRFIPVFCSNTEKTFMVVSGYRLSGLSYPDFQTKKIESQPNFSKLIKKQMCEDIINDFTFLDLHKRPIEVHGCCGPFSDWFMKDVWPTKTIKVKIDFKGEEYNENGFICPYIYNNSSELKYLLSDEYNLNATEPELAHIHMPGRFMFFESGEDWYMYSVIEMPGVGYFSPDQGIESIYLQRRESQKQKENILCRLAKQNIRRICVAVFTSRYFEDRVPFNYSGKVMADCEEQNISFQTEIGQLEATERSLREWMLDCKSFDNYGVKFEYLLSYAYESNQIFVYFRDKESGKVFPENLFTNVRFRLNPSIQEFEEKKGDKN